MKDTENITKTTDGNACFSRYFNTLSRDEDEQLPSRALIDKRTMELVRFDISQGRLPQTLRLMLKIAGADRFLPPQYRKFQPVVMEGAIFFLSHLPEKRIIEKITDQLVLPIGFKPGQRICTLVKDTPTLHKLLQIIGRSPGIDPDFKEFLVELEDNISTLNYDTLEPLLTDEFRHVDPSLQLILEKNILAEASVCAVIPGTLTTEQQGHDDSRYIWKDVFRKLTAKQQRQDKEQVPGQPIVCKLVKPAIKKNMSAELALWRRLGEYLDAHREKWEMGNFRFKETIDQVGWLLQNEIDLNLEQKNLDAVTHYYRADPSVSIPKKISVSTPNITVMTRLNGTKITDVAQLSGRQKRALAKKITNLCIVQPITALDRESIFHGDPHAGNIAFHLEKSGPRIIFYDWAMVGRFNRLERLAVTLMISGLILKNSTVIYYSADLMSGGKISANGNLGRKVNDLIKDSIDSREHRIKGILASLESLIKQLMFQGVIFSPDFLMFKKALVTLEGVLADIDPTFDRDEYVVRASTAQFASDVVHFRLQSIILKEIWMLYKSNLSLFIKIQKVLLQFGWTVARAYIPK